LTVTVDATVDGDPPSPPPTPTSHTPGIPQVRTTTSSTRSTRRLALRCGILPRKARLRPRPHCCGTDWLFLATTIAMCMRWRQPLACPRGPLRQRWVRQFAEFVASSVHCCHHRICCVVLARSRMMWSPRLLSAARTGIRSSSVAWTTLCECVWGAGGGGGGGGGFGVGWLGGWKPVPPSPPRWTQVCPVCRHRRQAVDVHDPGPDPGQRRRQQ
jgi:hypothetical protein